MAKETRKIKFVCNLPDPINNPDLLDLLDSGLTWGGFETEYVEYDPSWPIIGQNIVGPPHGPCPIEGDVGIYEIPKELSRESYIGEVDKS